MTKEIENLIRKSMALNIKLKMLEKENEGWIISKEIVLEILADLTEVAEEEPRAIHTHNKYGGMIDCAGCIQVRY